MEEEEAKCRGLEQMFAKGFSERRKERFCFYSIWK